MTSVTEMTESCESQQESADGQELIKASAQVQTRPTKCLHCSILVGWYWSGTSDRDLGHSTLPSKRIGSVVSHVINGRRTAWTRRVITSG